MPYTGDPDNPNAIQPEEDSGEATAWRQDWMPQVFIEAEAGSCERRRYDEATLAYQDTHTLPRPYPFAYGFIPGTRAEDGGAVDCYVITHQPLSVGSLVDCEPAGLLEVDENGEPDDKLLAVLPGQEVIFSDELHAMLRDFIQAIFAPFPEAIIQVGDILPAWAARDYLRQHRVNL